MRAVLLVAAREIRQVMATRGFWVMLLVVPLALAASGFASSKLAPERSSAYIIVDRTGRFAADLERGLDLGYQQRTLRDLSTYVDRWKLGAVDPQAPWANRKSWLSECEVRRFADAGGAEAAVKRLAPNLPKGAPAFDVPKPLFVRAAPPAGVPIDRGAEAFGQAIAKPLQNDVVTPKGKLPYALAVYIPENYGQPGAVARIWTSGRPDFGLLDDVRGGLGAALRRLALERSGIAPERAVQLDSLRAPVAVSEPPPGQGRSVIATRSIIPIALVYLLLITAITTGSMMLQGLVEERSNKLIESVLACIKPDALMQGKLLGLGVVGMVIILVWAGCAVGAAYSFAGVLADVLRPSLEALDNPWIVVAMIFYFLSGYIVLSMVFLAIGSVSDSMQDAQAYLTPVIMLVMIPVVILMQAALRSPDEFIVQLLSWIPLYTPFAMLARLGTGVSLAEIVGTSALLVVFMAVELMILGRVFRSSLLSAGKPGWRELVRKVRFSTEERQGAPRRATR
jgi:ABC-2 type transport system permease protein